MGGIIERRAPVLNAFPDTSFLCSLYVPLAHSVRAISALKRLQGPLLISPLLRYEFRQSVRLQIFRFQQYRTQGYSAGVAQQALRALQDDLNVGILYLANVDFADVLDHAERLSSASTTQGGHRSMDILHVATALHLGAKTFLTFDARQKALAESVGLRVGPV